VIPKPVFVMRMARGLGECMGKDVNGLTLNVRDV
jgi:hypothetical protein